MNTNAIHNLINIALAAIGAMTVFDWNVLFDAQTSATIMGGLGFAKLLINTTRDGLTNLFKPQPPVGS